MIYIKGYIVAVSLLLPLVAVNLVGITLNYYWRYDALAMAFYASCFCVASSALSGNYIYRLSISSVIFFISFAYRDFWPAIQIGLTVGYASLFATSVIPKKWNKKCWLIFPYSITRLVIAYLSLYIIPFDFVDGDLFDKNIAGLLGCTYSLLVLLLLLDLLFKKVVFNVFLKGIE